MSTSLEQSRWIGWQPKGRILDACAEMTPTKPTKPAVGVGREGFEGEPTQAEVDEATALLNRAGVRVMLIGDVMTVGVWPDVDGPVIRAALCTLGMHSFPVRHLDENVIPERYKTRVAQTL